ncbi:MAG: D-aminoacylase [Pseudomonadota bacterium]
MERCHLLIRSAKVIDGTGAPATKGDIAVEGARIAAIGDLSDWRADETIDATGLAIAPGFIDDHTHDDSAVLAERDMTKKVSQGVTSVVAGNCGISLAPLSPKGPLPPPFPLLDREGVDYFPTIEGYAQALERTPPALNIGLLTGHGNLRVAAMGEDLERAANGAEIDDMGQRLAAALDQGSLGLSTGLGYPNCWDATTDELIGIAKHMKGKVGALFCSHMRDESDQVLAAVEETLEIGRRAETAVVISHHKCSGTSNWGRSTETLAAIEAAAQSQAVALDVYPYTASSTVLMAEYMVEADDVMVTYSDPHPEAAGRHLAEIAAEWGCSEHEAVDRLHPAGAIYWSMDEADIERIIAYSRTMIGSDGLPGAPHPHPRLWGTFPRVLARYVRERGVLSLEEAVHRMTGLTAQTFGLKDRGTLAPGHFADIVIFDPASVRDRATFEQPKQTAEGIVLVLVNGTPVWRDGAHSGATPGAFLARAS